MSEPTNLILPIIHSNGSGRYNLLQDRFDVLHNLVQTIAALEQMRPHERDYYVQPGTFKLAVVQHQLRMTLLTKLKSDIYEEVQRLTDNN